MCISVNGSSRTMSRDWRIWQGTSSAPAFLRSGWYIFRLRNPQMGSPRSLHLQERKTRKTFDAVDWSRRRDVPLAHLVTHVPGRYEQTVRYYGYYSNKSGGLRKKAETDDIVPVIVKDEMSSREWRQNWARLIQKIAACPELDSGRWILSYAPSARAK